jgi:hypothetical protein
MKIILSPEQKNVVIRIRRPDMIFSTHGQTGIGKSRSNLVPYQEIGNKIRYEKCFKRILAQIIPSTTNQSNS